MSEWNDFRDTIANTSTVEKSKTFSRSIVLGAMEKKLSVQLAGLNISNERLRVLDKLAESLTWLYLHSILTDSQYSAAGRKIIAKVQADVRKAANDKLRDPAT